MPNQLLLWHDFYVLIGAASATLIGLTFVAVSVGASYIDTEREAPMRAFLTPTVLHFTAILLVCLIGAIPSHTRASLAALIAACGFIGFGFAVRVVMNMHRRGMIARMDVADRCCYVVLPLLSYLALVGNGIALFYDPGVGLDLLAATIVALLLLGIRNAWDMTLWIVVRTESR